MKIIVVSDSHGNEQGIDKIIKTNDFDYFFFLGDGLGDLGNYKYLDNVYYVSGNCDFFSTDPDEQVVEIVGKKILLTHGHKYKVKNTLDNLINRAVELGVDIVFYGHTHINKIESMNNIYFINPGSFRNSFGHIPEAIVVDIDGDSVIVNRI